MPIKDHPFCYRLSDHPGLCVYEVYSNRRLTMKEVGDAVEDVSRHSNRRRETYPDNGVVYDFVDVHFCAEGKDAEDVQCESGGD